MSREPSRADSAAAGFEHELALTFANRAAALAAAQESVRTQLRAWGVDERAVYGVALVLEELAGNALRYGYDAGAEGSLSVELAVSRTLVRVTLTDDGRPFDPTRAPDPERPRTVAEAPIGGRGIAMVRRVAGAMRYRRDAGWNRLEVDVPRTVAPH